MRLILRHVGSIWIIASFFLLLPVGVGLFYRENVLGLSVAALLLILGGVFLRAKFIVKRRFKFLSFMEGLVVTALSFVTLSLAGAIPFLDLFGGDFWYAWFESVSGVTTTGLSMLDSLAEVPRSLLLWRAEMQWMGGVGIVMVFLFIVLTLHRTTAADKRRATIASVSSLYQALGFSDKAEPNFRRTVSSVVKVYVLYTLLGFLFLQLVGLNWFEALGTTFAALSTGGFSMTDEFYTGDGPRIIVTILMILGAVSFFIHHHVLQHKWRKVFSLEVKMMLFLLLGGISLGFLVLDDFRVVVFEMVSALTTTGYSITTIDQLPHLFILIMTVAMIVGGSVGSTSGGLKLSRVYTLLATIPWLIRKMIYPATAVLPFKVGERSMEDENLIMVQIFFVTYVLLLLGGVLIFMIFGYPFFESSFHVVSALGTVGLQTMSLAVLPVLLKLLLIVYMLLGRLEIFPLMVLLVWLFKKR